MENASQVAECCCGSQHENAATEPLLKAKKTARSIPSVVLSVLIAFFPKCPLCWAVYMSMFSSLGIAKLPYMGWLLPVLLTFLCIHLFLLYKKATHIGYLPFAISLFGALTILMARAFFPAEKWLLILGMAAIISGSLLNSFSGNLLKLKTRPI